MMRLWVMSAVVCLFSLPLGAQTAYQVPIGSRDNVIELGVENSSVTPIQGIKVSTTGKPDWLHITPESQEVAELKSNSEQTLRFTFNVDRSAPVGAETKLVFMVVSPEGQEWKKEIALIAGAPERFELVQNYPNPFNPSTVIGYTVPQESFVTLKVYNVLGEEVATLARSSQKAGAYSATWNATSFPSGVYFYRLQAMPTGRQAGDFHEVRKMLLMR